ncbi:MAG: chaperonin GroEL [Lachnospiraceae bacterium]|nr:chaperonin GroEL [Lachnospiraceae bacterium]
MKKIILGNTRSVINETVSEFENLVCATMGPYGQTIAFQNEIGVPVITKDGVSVAKAIEFDKPEKNLIAKILKQAAEKTNDEAGDGTTTSTAIASATVREGNKALAAGNDVNSLRRGINQSLEKVLARLDQQRVDFSDKTENEKAEILTKIAMISTNGDHKISELIASAVAKAGRSGVVNVQKGALDFSLVQSTGMKIPNASFTDYEFVRGSAEKKVILKKCRILITTYDLESANVIRALDDKVLTPIMNAGETLLVMPRKADKGFLANMINNNAKGYLRNVVVKAPYFGAVGREMMDDVAAMTGATVIDEREGHKLQNIQLSNLGYAEEVEVNAHSTILFQPKKDEARVAKRIKILEDKAKAIDYKRGDADKTLERLAAITGSVYNVKIPSFSEVEDKEIMDRVEDAINACKGALEFGYLPGGGMALLKIAHEISSESSYSAILCNIISYPFKRILDNAGKNHELISNQLMQAQNDYVYDAREGKFGEALELGIIDSYKVVTKSLTNGISVGLMLLTTVGLIADLPEQGPIPFEWDPSMS